MNFIEYAPLGLSAIAVTVSIMAWYKSRVIYKIVTEDNRGENNKVNDLLKTGKYTILHVQSDPSNHMRTIYTLGKVSNH